MRHYSVATESQVKNQKPAEIMRQYNAYAKFRRHEKGRVAIVHAAEQAPHPLIHFMVRVVCNSALGLAALSTFSALHGSDPNMGFAYMFKLWFVCSLPWLTSSIWYRVFDLFRTEVDTWEKVLTDQPPPLLASVNVVPCAAQPCGRLTYAGLVRRRSP
jgi:hypothetical protein